MLPPYFDGVAVGFPFHDTVIFVIKVTGLEGRPGFTPSWEHLFSLAGGFIEGSWNNKPFVKDLNMI